MQKWTRRTVLAWLGLMPVALKAFPSLAVETSQSAVPVPRVRPWRMRLEPDGSSTLMKGDKRFLEEWVKSTDQVGWDEGGWKGGEPLPDIGKIIQDDIAAVEERAKVWTVWKDLEEQFGIIKDGKVFSPGTHFEMDHRGHEDRQKLPYHVEDSWMRGGYFDNIKRLNPPPDRPSPMGFGSIEEDYLETWEWVTGEVATPERRWQIGGANGRCRAI